MKKVTQEISINEISRNSFIGFKAWGSRHIIFEKFDCSFIPLNITNGGAEWASCYCFPTKKELVSALVKEGNDVFVFDSMQELLAWTITI